MTPCVSLTSQISKFASVIVKEVKIIKGTVQAKQNITFKQFIVKNKIKSRIDNNLSTNNVFAIIFEALIYSVILHTLFLVWLHAETFCS